MRQLLAVTIFAAILFAGTGLLTKALFDTAIAHMNTIAASYPKAPASR